MDISELEKNIRQDFSTVQDDMMNLKVDIDAGKKEIKDIKGKFDVMVNDLKNIIEHLKLLEKPEGSEEEGKEEFEEFTETPEGAEEGAEEIKEELPELPNVDEGEPSIDDLDLGTEDDLDVPPEPPELVNPEKKTKGKKSKSKVSPFYKSIKKKK